MLVSLSAKNLLNGTACFSVEETVSQRELLLKGRIWEHILSFYSGYHENRN